MALINSDKIPLPARTIRFFWVPETLGTVAYLSHHEDMHSKLVAGINLDMVGQNQELCKSTLNLDRTPDSCPSYLNDYVYSLIEQSIKEFDTVTGFGSAATFRYNTTIQWPDLYYHTSMDTIDKVSEDSLKRVGWITTTAALTLTDATAETAYQLANLTASKGIIRIEETAQKGIEELFKKKEDPKLKDKKAELAKELAKTAFHYKNKIEHATWREQQATKSVERLAKNQELGTLIDKLCEEIANRSQQKIAMFEEALTFIAKTLALAIPDKPEETEADAELKRLIPKRLFKGTLNFDTLKKILGEKEYEWYQEIDEKDRNFHNKAAEFVNFMDGKRTAHYILKDVSAEYTPTNPEHALKFLRDLKKANLITF
jgi:hypothetical protein